MNLRNYVQDVLHTCQYFIYPLVILHIATLATAHEKGLFSIAAMLV